MGSGSFVFPGGFMDKVLGGAVWDSALLLSCQVSEGHREKARESPVCRAPLVLPFAFFE